MKIINKCLKYQKLHLQYLIGHSQVALEQENKVFWSFCEFIRMFQTIALVLLYQHIVRMLNTNIKFDQSTDISLERLELLCRITMPTILIQEYLSLEQIIYFQLIFLISLFLMLLINIIALRIEYIHFKQIKVQNRNAYSKSDGNNYQSFNLLNNTYNNGDFVEYFLLKQLMGNENGSWIELQLLRTSLLTNYFTHVLFLPQIYWICIIFYRIHNQSGYSLSLFIINFTLNIIQLSFLVVLEGLSLYMQQSYRLKDTNYLRLRITTSFKIGQMLRIIPTLMYFGVIYIVDPSTIYTNQVFKQIITCFVLLNLIFDLQDQSFNIPFVQPYKIQVFHFTFSLTFSLTLLTLFELHPHETITLMMMATPCICKMLNQLTDFSFKKIITQTLHPENVIPKQKIFLQKNSHSITKSLILNDDVHQIERQIYIKIQEQASMIRLTNYQYFLQFLRLFNLLRIQEQQVFQTTEVFNPNKSKFLMQCLILIKMHTEQCNNVYCFCRGFLGEKKTTIEAHLEKQDMKIYSDFQCKGVVVSVELIKRYLRYYIKLILNISIYTQSPDLTYVAQLISVLCESDESLQAWLQVMELKLQLNDLKKPFDQITMNLITSYAKCQSLQKTQTQLNEKLISKIIVYEDYRYTECKRLELTSKIMQGLDYKKNYLIKLANNKVSYEQAQEIFLESHVYYMNLEKNLLQFYNSSLCRTSCLLLMFYFLDVRCDFISFGKFKNLLRSKEVNFFENPVGANVLQQVCFLKVNLSRFSKHKCRGEILATSENAFNFFGYETKEQFIDQVQTVHQLVPPLISFVHNTIIELFLMSNRPSVLRKERYLIAQKCEQEIVYVEMFIDLCFIITGTQFPVYCFMQEIKPIGVFENVRGHIIIDDYEMIQGISQIAYQSLFLDSASDICNKEISEFYADFTEKAQKLNQMMDTKTQRDKFRPMTASTQSQLIVQQKDANSVYNHYKLKLEEQLFVMNGGDRFLIDMTITLAYGIVHGKISKFYVIEFNKVQQLDATDYVDSHGNGSYRSSMKQSYFTQRTNTLYDVQDDEKHSDEQSIKLRQYSFPQITDQCVTTQNQMQPLKQEELQDQVQPIKVSERRSKFFTFKGAAKKSDSKNQFSESSNHQASVTSNKLQSDGQKFQQKGMLYFEYSHSQSETLVNIIHAINILILGVIFIFLLLYQLRFRQQAYSIIPTIDILQAFITTDYTDNIQLSLMHYKELAEGTGKQDLYYQDLQRLLQKDAQNYLVYQKTYLLNDKIKTVFSDTQIATQNNSNTSAWNAAFEILYQQLDFAQNQHVNQTNITPTFVYLMAQFPYHKAAYESINDQFSQQVSLSITNFTDSQQVLIIILIVMSIVISLISLLAYYNYYTYLKKITRCSEQVSLEAIESEINICSSLTVNKQVKYVIQQKFCIYEYRMDFSSGFDQRLHQDGQTHFSSYKALPNQSSNVKRQLNFSDQITVSRALSFLYPLFSLIVALIFLGITYSSIQGIMNTLQIDITLYNQGIKFQENFSLLCFSSILQENKDYLKSNNYITDQQLTTYYNYISPSITNVQKLSKNIRLPKVGQSTSVIGALSINICELLDDQTDIKICQVINSGLLQNGVLESTQVYFVQYRNNFELNYKEIIDYSTSEDIIAINFIIKGITNYINTSKADLQNYITTQIDTNMNLFIFIFIVTILFQIFLSAYISIHLSSKLKNLKNLMFLLPRDTLYANDSFMKTLNYVQRHQNDICQ